VEEVNSIFEQLSLTLTTEPSSVFALFGLAANQVYRQLGEYLDAVRALYSGQSLAGLPASVEVGLLSQHPIRRSIAYMHVFDNALTGENDINKAVEYAEEIIDDVVEEVVENVRVLTVEGFDNNVRAHLDAVESSYDDVSLPGLEDYLSSFSRFTLTSKSLQSVGEKIREQLTFYALEYLNKTREEEAGTSNSLLAMLIASKTLLRSLSSTPSFSGEVILGPFDDLTFPDDDLLLEGTTGATVPDVVVLSGDGIDPLTVTADPTESGDTTTRVLADAPFKFALEAEVVVDDAVLLSSSGSGTPVLRTSGTGATPVVPPDPTQVVRDVAALFQAYGIESGDRWLSLTETGVGPVVNNRWHVVEELVAGFEQTDIQVTVATSFAAGLTIDYEIYRPATNILVDTTANFGLGLLGKRLTVANLGSTVITRVVDANTLELADYLIPILTVDGSGPTTNSHDYTIYEFQVPAGREARVTDGTDLFDYDLPPRIAVRLSTAAGGYSEGLLEAVVEDQAFLLEQLVVPGSYTALFVFPVQPGDVLHFAASDHVVTKVVADDLVFVSPPVEATLAAEEAKILPPQFSGVTRVFYDASADFEAAGVYPDSLLIVTVEGKVRRCAIKAVTTNSLRLNIPLLVDKTNLDYRILRREDASTDWAETSESLASVQVDDMLSASGRTESTITGIDGQIMTVSPGSPVTADPTSGLVSRGGTAGYGHYAMAQDLLFGGTPTELLDPTNLRSKIGLCITDPGDTGASISTTGASELIDAGGEVSDRMRVPGLSFLDIKFGDLLEISTSDLSGPVVLYRYVREWLESDSLISFFPSIDLSTYSDSLTAVDLRRSKGSNAIYEASLVEASVVAVRAVISQLVSPKVSSLDSLLAFLASRKYDRAVDLLVAGDLETLAASSEKGLSYAGYLGELVAETVPLL